MNLDNLDFETIVNVDLLEQAFDEHEVKMIIFDSRSYSLFPKPFSKGFREIWRMSKSFIDEFLY